MLDLVSINRLIVIILTVDWWLIGALRRIYIYISFSPSLFLSLNAFLMKDQDFTACTLHLNVSWFIISGRAGGGGGGGAGRGGGA